jgi:DNA polymerase-3 subunit epsilon
VISNEQVIDTLMMARKKYPGGQASLDALCKKFGVDNSGRDLHGALIDADLLALVYIELIGGKQPDLMGELAQDESTDHASANAGSLQPLATRDCGHRPRRDFPEHADERVAHQHFIGMMENPLWDKYQS